MNFIIPYTDKSPALKLKRILLIKLIDGIREYFPKAKIVLTSSTPLPDDIKNLVDFHTQAEHKTWYHGCEWLHTMKKGIDILDNIGSEYHYYVCYDSILNQDSIDAYKEWEKICKDTNLDLVISRDFGANNAFDTNQWYGKTKLIKEIFSYSGDITHAESWIYYMGRNHKNIYVYENEVQRLKDRSTHWNIMCFGGTGARKDKIEYFQKFYNLSNEDIDKDNIKLY